MFFQNIPVLRSAYFPIPHRPTFGAPVFQWAGEASLSPFCAPKCPFRTFRCFAWLIQLRQRTALSPLKRSCFSRFAASEPRTVLPFLCAFLVGLFSVCAPNQLFKLLRCSAWLIFREEHIVLFTPKRSCSRFAARTLRIQGNQTARPYASPV